jgi:hypothetical protein
MVRDARDEIPDIARIEFQGVALGVNDVFRGEHRDMIAARRNPGP